MTQCLNPQCLAVNPDHYRFCQRCGKPLWLKERYQAVKLIGQGGFGKTFLAIDHDKPSKPYCVIKQFCPQGSGTEGLAKAEQLFAEEAKRLDELGHHDQIPSLLAYFTIDGQQYLVQEYVEGQNLEEELEQFGPFDQHKIEQLLLDLLPVLNFIHQVPVIHRDIKPANIIRRTKDQKLVIVDFGAAKKITEKNQGVTGTQIGSVEYVAPEQLVGKPVTASDLYSLGVTCIYLLTSISPLNLFNSYEYEWVWRDYLVDNLVDEKLGKILDKMICTKIKERYKGVNDIIQHLYLYQKDSKIQPNVNSQFIRNQNNTYFDSEKFIFKCQQSRFLSELDQALIDSVANYFKLMIDKILRYHSDHNASYEEAEVLSRYYNDIENFLRKIKSRDDIQSIIDRVQRLKKMTDRYRHSSRKYQWSYGLEKNVLDKLRMIISNSKPNLVLVERPVRKKYSNLAYLTDLDKATVNKISDYLKDMTSKIIKYHKDHYASKPEAEVISRYYSNLSDYLKTVKEYGSLLAAIDSLNSLSFIISYYRHDSRKYQWCVNLESNALPPLKLILADLDPLFTQQLVKHPEAVVNNENQNKSVQKPGIIPAKIQDKYLSNRSISANFFLTFLLTFVSSYIYTRRWGGLVISVIIFGSVNILSGINDSSFAMFATNTFAFVDNSLAIKSAKKGLKILVIPRRFVKFTVSIAITKICQLSTNMI
ncbi:protein kinase [Synechocystis sp. PCC 7338]|nr:protein kinase [Synechocystis sp. PCC 7338]